MEGKMFCYQCEQTSRCTACTGNAGVCGKKSDTAALQDNLTGGLIGLARAAKGSDELSDNIYKTIIEGLFTTLTNVSFDNESIQNQIDLVKAEKEKLSGGNGEDYPMNNLWEGDADVRSLKSLILFGIRGMAAYAYHALMLGYTDRDVNEFFCEALCKIGNVDSTADLLPTVMKVGEVNLKCMALLDEANTKAYGAPEPTTVSMKVEKGPFIVVQGMI